MVSQSRPETTHSSTPRRSRSATISGSLGDAFVEADGFTGGFEHRAVLDAVNDFRRVRAEAEVDYFHQLTLLAWCTKRFVSIRANAVPVLHRQGDSPTTARKWGLTKNVPD